MDEQWIRDMEALAQKLALQQAVTQAITASEEATARLVHHAECVRITRKPLHVVVREWINDERPAWETIDQFERDVAWLVDLHA